MSVEIQDMYREELADFRKKVLGPEGRSHAGQPISPASEGNVSMTAGRWLYVAIAATILVVSVVMALQGSSGLWFTAVAMALAVISVLWRSRKRTVKTPTTQRH